MKKIIIVFCTILQLICITSISNAIDRKESVKSYEEVTLTNINTASDTALRSLPGIGESNAMRIIAGRPYTNKDQLRSRKILRESTFRKIRRLITVEPGRD